MRRVRDYAPPTVQKTYEFVLWLVKKVENFPILSIAWRSPAGWPVRVTDGDSLI